MSVRGFAYSGYACSRCARRGAYGASGRPASRCSTGTPPPRSAGGSVHRLDARDDESSPSGSLDRRNVRDVHSTLPLMGWQAHRQLVRLRPAHAQPRPHSRTALHRAGPASRGCSRGRARPARPRSPKAAPLWPPARPSWPPARDGRRVGNTLAPGVLPPYPEHGLPGCPMRVQHRPRKGWVRWLGRPPLWRRPCCRRFSSAACLQQVSSGALHKRANLLRRGQDGDCQGSLLEVFAPRADRHLYAWMVR